jgi:hypothetical protein
VQYFLPVWYANDENAIFLAMEQFFLYIWNNTVYAMSSIFYRCANIEILFVLQILSFLLQVACPNLGIFHLPDILRTDSNMQTAVETFSTKINVEVPTPKIKKQII